MTERLALPGYRLGSLVSRTATSSRYEAVQTSSERRVVVEILNREAVRSVTSLKRFTGAQECGRALRHRYIVPVLEAGCEDGVYYLVTEDVPGEPLDAVTRREQLPLSAVGDVLRNVGEAIDYAHEHGCTHGNLALAQLLYQPHSPCLVTGFAYRWTRDPARGVRIEDELGAQWVDACRGDLYALGKVLAELVGVEASTLTVGIGGESGSARRRPPVSNAIREVIQRAIHPDPARRFASGAELAQTFRSAASTHRSSDRRSDPGTVRQRPQFGALGSAVPEAPRPAPAAPARTPSGSQHGAALAGGAIIVAIAGFLILRGAHHGEAVTDPPPKQPDNGPVAPSPPPRPTIAEIQPKWERLQSKLDQLGAKLNGQYGADHHFRLTRSDHAQIEDADRQVQEVLAQLDAASPTPDGARDRLRAHCFRELGIDQYYRGNIQACREKLQQSAQLDPSDKSTRQWLAATKGR